MRFFSSDLNAATVQLGRDSIVGKLLNQLAGKLIANHAQLGGGPAPWADDADAKLATRVMAKRQDNVIFFKLQLFLQSSFNIT